MRPQREFGGVLNWILILLAAAGLVASIIIPGRAYSRAERERAVARQDMLDIVTAENRAYSETQHYLGSLDSLQLFLEWQTKRYDSVLDSLIAFFDLSEQGLEQVNRAATQAGDLREYLQYVGDLALRDAYVAIADSAYQYLRFRGDLQAGEAEFSRLFDEIAAALNADMLAPAEFEALAGKVDSLELIFRADPAQLEKYGAYREDLYLTRALIPARERFQATLKAVDTYLESGYRAPAALRVAASQADSLRFCFLFGGDAQASEALEDIHDFLAYRADLIERKDGYDHLFDLVADYLRDPGRDPEIARDMSDHVDSLKYCFLFDSPGALGVPLEEGADAEVSRTADLSRISNFLYGLASAWNTQVDSLSEIIPESKRKAHKKARAELRTRFAQEQEKKLEEARGYAEALGVMKEEFATTLEHLNEDLVKKREAIPAVRAALEARIAGAGTQQTVTLAELRALFEQNLKGNPARAKQLKGQLTSLDRASFPPSSFHTHSPAYPRAMYRLELEGDKVSVRPFHREEFGEIVEGDATW